MDNSDIQNHSIYSNASFDSERFRQLKPRDLPLIASECIKYCPRQGIREKKAFREALRLTLGAIFHYGVPIQKILYVFGEPLASLLRAVITHAGKNAVMDFIDPGQLSINQLNRRGVQNLRKHKIIQVPLRNPVSMATLRLFMNLTLSDRISTSLNQSYASAKRKSVLITYADSDYRDLPYSDSLRDVILPFQFRSEKISTGQLSLLKTLVTSPSEIRKFIAWLKWDRDPGYDHTIDFDWFEAELQQWELKNNLLAHFIDEACMHGPKLRILNNDLYAFYCAFCEKHHHRIPLDVEDFGEQMGRENRHTTSIGLRKNERPPEWKKGDARPKRRFFNHMDLKPEYRKQLSRFLLSEKERANRIHDQLRWG